MFIIGDIVEMFTPK